MNYWKLCLRKPIKVNSLWWFFQLVKWPDSPQEPMAGRRGRGGCQVGGVISRSTASPMGLAAAAVADSLREATGRLKFLRVFSRRSLAWRSSSRSWRRHFCSYKKEKQLLFFYCCYLNVMPFVIWCCGTVSQFSQEDLLLNIRNPCKPEVLSLQGLPLLNTFSPSKPFVIVAVDHM